MRAMTTGYSWWVVGVLSAVVAVGCAADVEPSDSMQNPLAGCEPGETLACSCPDGTPSVRQCGPVGAFLACTCANGDQAAGPMGEMPPAGPAEPMTPPGAMDPMGTAGMGADDPLTPGPEQMPEMPDPVMPDPMEPMEPMEPMTPDPMTPDPMPGDGVEIPEGEHCAAVADWDPMWVQFEEEVLLFTNEARAVGHNCDSEGQFGPTEPLAMNSMLRCSARLHSMDMGQMSYFAHDSQDGRSPFARMAEAGYMGGLMGENIAKGQQSPREVVDGWLDSDGHCSNMLNPGYTELGVGYWEGEADNQFFNGNKLWTQNFGASGGGGNCWWCN